MYQPLLLTSDSRPVSQMSVIDITDNSDGAQCVLPLEYGNMAYEVDESVGVTSDENCER